MKRLLVLLLLFVVILAGCGGDFEEEDLIKVSAQCPNGIASVEYDAARRIEKFRCK